MRVTDLEVHVDDIIQEPGPAEDNDILPERLDMRDGEELDEVIKHEFSEDSDHELKL